MFGFGAPEALLLSTPLVIIFILIGLMFYFIPFIIAYYRNHNNTTPIFILNFFLGWSFIAWVIALIWAMTNDTRNKEQ